MWFRHAFLYELETPLDYDPEALSARLATHTFTPCDSITPTSAGWFNPTPHPHFDSLVYAANGFLLFCLKHEEKLLPNSVLREELQKRVTQIQQREGRKVGKKEQQSLREEIYHSFLPRAFTRSSLLFAVIDTQTHYLMINTSSPSKAEFFINTLRKTLGSFKVEPLDMGTPSIIMTHWLTHGLRTPEFSLSDQCLLQNPLQEAGKIRCQKQDLQVDGIKTFLKERFYVTQIALQWQEQMSFVLTDTFSLKQIRFLESVKEMAHDAFSETEADRFDVSFTLMTGLLKQMLQKLITLFKDEQAQQNAEKTVISSQSSDLTYA